MGIVSKPQPPSAALNVLCCAEKMFALGLKPGTDKDVAAVPL